MIDDVYDRENDWYRDAARQLSYVRDAQALLETYDDLADYYADAGDWEALRPIRDGLAERRAMVARDEAERSERLEDFRTRIEKGKRRVDAWTLGKLDFDAVFAGLGKTYRRGVRAMDDAYDTPTVEGFHEWRKRTKYHWYHLRLLRRLWDEVIKAQRDEAKRLADDLGDDHDLSILRQTLIEDADRLGDAPELQTLLGMIDRRQAMLRAQARPLGMRIFQEKPKALTRRLHGYWDAWQYERKLDDVASSQELLPTSAANNW